MKNAKCKVQNDWLTFAGMLLAGLLVAAAGCGGNSEETDASAHSNPDHSTAATNSGVSENAADSPNGSQGLPFGVRQTKANNSATTEPSQTPVTNETPDRIPEEESQAVIRNSVEQPAARVQATAGDWPRFRGPHGSGVSSETGLPLKWSASENIVWKVDLPGPGASSPITFGDHVYVTCYSGYGINPQAPGNVGDLKRHLVCVERKSGDVLWEKAMPSQATDQPWNDSLGKHGYASSTPVADEDGVYVFYGASGVAAYTHAGDQRWHRSCGTGVTKYGSASSPILVEDMLIIDASVEAGGYPGSAGLCALDKRTGDVIWKKTNIGAGGYLTPTLVEVNGKKELVVSQPWGHELAGASVENGERLWFCKVSAYTPTPVVDSEGILYAFSKSSYAAIRTGGSGDVTGSHLLWEQKSAVYRQSSPLYWEGHLYWMPMDLGIACCANARTGELVYRERVSPATGQVYASPVLADGRIYFISREKGTFVLPARPEFGLLAHNVIESDSSIFNGSPAVSSGRLFLRSNRALYCIGQQNRDDTASTDSINTGPRDEPSDVPERTPRTTKPMAAPEKQQQSGADDWPGFRGAKGDGVSAATELPVEWDSTTNLLWHRNLPGPGASSPIVWGDRVYVTAYSGYGESVEAPGDSADLQRHLICVGLKNGEILWETVVPSKVSEIAYEGGVTHHGYASSTPVADESGVYVYYGSSGVWVYTHAGELKWRKSCGTNVYNYGSAASPVLVGDYLIVNASVESRESNDFGAAGALIAFKKETGKEAWRRMDIYAGYPTPVRIQTGEDVEILAGKRGGGLIGHSLRSGEKLWECAVPIYAPTPVVHDDIAFVLAKNGYAAVRTGGRGDVSATHRLWEIKKSAYRLASPIYSQGYLYWMPKNPAIAHCANAETGELVYQKRLNPPADNIYASPVLAGGKIYYVSQRSGTYVLAASPEFQLLAHNVIETDPSIFNGSPAVSGGRIILRSNRCLYCIGAGE